MAITIKNRIKQVAEFEQQYAFNKIKLLTGLMSIDAEAIDAIVRGTRDGMFIEEMDIERLHHWIDRHAERSQDLIDALDALERATAEIDANRWEANMCIVEENK